MHLIHTQIKGFELVFESSDDQFSPRRIDAGTLALLSVVDFAEGDRVLDLGCGYGVVGVLAARVVGPGNVVMVDNDPAAVALARKNCKRNGVEGVEVILSEGFSHMDVTGFDLILSNPPFHLGHIVDHEATGELIRGARDRLAPGGRLRLVANTFLPYEPLISQVFHKQNMRQVHHDSKFKVLEAIASK